MILTELQYKRLMEDVGLPNSRSLLKAFQHCAMEVTLLERERCAKIAEKYEPDEKSDIPYASTEIRNR